MENVLVRRGLDFTLRKKKWIILLGLIGFSSYGAYKVYSLPSLAKKRRRILKLFESLISMAEMASDSAETVAVVSRDLKEFLKSDSDEIPNRLKQLSKIARSEEFSQSVIRVSQSMTVGVLRGYKVESSEIRGVDDSSFSDRVMDKLMSSVGTGFVSSVVGSFARNLVMGFYANGGSGEGSSDASFLNWVNVVSDDKCRVLAGECIKSFVGTAVAVYLDKTMNVNFYDELFSGLTNPKHQDKVTDVLVSLFNGAVETLVKASHQVLTTSKSVSSDQSEASSILENPEALLKKVKEVKGSINLQKRGWVDNVSSTLAVQSNRRFVLDVTGRVTFETIRSIIQFIVWKLSGGLRSCFNVIHDEVVERGFELVRYVGAKSSVILTICLALFLHICGNTRVLLPP